MTVTLDLSNTSLSGRFGAETDAVDVDVDVLPWIGWVCECEVESEVVWGAVVVDAVVVSVWELLDEPNACLIWSMTVMVECLDQGIS